ncbi:MULTISPECIES: HD domain-containing phosphohydrolase [unclassified Pseudodesulfovibrio]|uniref:HD-GYP domain-containing protein n=1 Tax=unclassified Pseudodesulfovibrio TaxID=2661612 RepID=UPI000FEB765E|nr:MULTISPECIES: HD domain-containing phosphohydrolase [unclassified Pseudodesulfovibrio]MCJ2165723.1 HD domain-containing protein [Pseudodesulfovibrio sp. S3-i]RWU02905.1 HD domain-containing protein [Pseudodesulfovibrio sp. S3]
MTQQPFNDSILNALIGIARAAEARNALTAEHSECVALVAHGIGRELGLTAGETERLLLMGRLHNIGLVGTQDSILLKTDKLTPEEFEHIKGHTTLGARLLAPIPELTDVAEVCLNHHERWDGSGYPNGIAGEDIPRFARLISVADTFCAIISERPHRDSLPLPVAADIIEEERGTRLCPECVDGFMLWYEKTGGKIGRP